MKLILLKDYSHQSCFQTKEEEEVFTKKRSKKAQKKFEERKKTAKVEQSLDEQFGTSRVLGKCVEELFSAIEI